MICDVCSPVAQAQKLKAFIRGETLLTAIAFVNHWMGAGDFRVRVDDIFVSHCEADRNICLPCASKLAFCLNKAPIRQF
jgi:hypothetical protein